MRNLGRSFGELNGAAGACRQQKRRVSFRLSKIGKFQQMAKYLRFSTALLITAPLFPMVSAVAQDAATASPAMPVRTNIYYDYASLYEYNNSEIPGFIPRSVLYVDVYSCSPVLLTIKAAADRIVGRAGPAYVTSTSVITKKDGSFEIGIRAEREIDAGSPYVIIMRPGGSGLANLNPSKLPVCLAPQPSSEEIAARFGTLANRVGSTFVNPTKNHMIDYRWLKKGEVLDGIYRRTGKSETAYHYIHVYDHRLGRLIYVPMDGMGTNKPVNPPTEPVTGALAYQSDIEQGPAKRSGGGLFGMLGQLAGAAAGMALTNGSMAGAMAGASVFAGSDEQRQAYLQAAQQGIANDQANIQQGQQGNLASPSGQYPQVSGGATPDMGGVTNVPVPAGHDSINYSQAQIDSFMTAHHANDAPAPTSAASSYRTEYRMTTGAGAGSSASGTGSSGANRVAGSDNAGSSGAPSSSGTTPGNTYANGGGTAGRSTSTSRSSTSQNNSTSINNVLIVGPSSSQAENEALARRNAQAQANAAADAATRRAEDAQGAADEKARASAWDAANPKKPRSCGAELRITCSAIPR